jgi:hypothetical protein
MTTHVDLNRTAEQTLTEGVERQHRLASWLLTALIVRQLMSFARYLYPPDAGWISLGLYGVLSAGLSMLIVWIWIAWVGRAYANLQLVGSRKQDQRNRVWQWLVPIANLVFGYRILKELWQRSESRNATEEVDKAPAPRTVLVWVIVSAVFIGEEVLRRKAASSFWWSTLAGQAAYLLLTIAAFRVVAAIDRFQTGWTSDMPESASETEQQHYFDPTIWGDLVRVLMLFLVMATAAAYNRAWTQVFAAWLPTPVEANTLGIRIEPISLVLFFLPWLFSQLVTAAWLLWHGVRKPNPEDRAYQIAKDALESARKFSGGHRRPRIAVAGVDPRMVSLLGIPILLLPRQGLRLFDHRLGPKAESGFRSAIFHEAGHLASWDDVLYPPAVYYGAFGILVCCIGIGLAASGQLALAPVLARLTRLLVLFVGGYYVLRRRESYADSFSVLLSGCVKLPLDTLRKVVRKDEGATYRWWEPHFDVSTRVRLLPDSGRTLLEMSPLDLCIAAFIWFNLSERALGSLVLTSNATSGLVFLTDGLSRFFLLLYFVLTIAGLAVAREGVPPRRVDLLAAGVASGAIMEGYEIVSANLFNDAAVFMQFLVSGLTVLFESAVFILVFHLFFKWMVAVLDAARQRPRQHVWQAVVVSAVWMAIGSGGSIALRGLIVPVLNHTIDVNQITAPVPSTTDLVAISKMPALRFVLPVYLIGVLMFFAYVLLLVAVAISTWVYRKKQVAEDCASCGQPVDKIAKPLLRLCPSCHAILRPELVISVPYQCEEVQ